MFFGIKKLNYISKNHPYPFDISAVCGHVQGLETAVASILKDYVHVERRL